MLARLGLSGTLLGSRAATATSRNVLFLMGNASSARLIKTKDSALRGVTMKKQELGLALGISQIRAATKRQCASGAKGTMLASAKSAMRHGAGDALEWRAGVATFRQQRLPNTARSTANLAPPAVREGS